jgi:hypothetical protein
MSNQEKKLSDFIEEQEQQNKDILGYGKKLKVFIGKKKIDDKDTDEDEYKEYHFCPVPLSDIPELTKSLDAFGRTANNKSWSQDALKSIAKIIQLSLKKAHGEIPIETILKEFDFGSLAKSVKIAINLNDFLSEMQAIQETFKNLEISDKKNKTN